MTVLPLTDKLERDWDRDLFNSKKGLAPLLGWESHWTFLSKGSRAGFPDRTLCRDRVIFAELKRELTGRKSEDANRQPTEHQVAWLDRLARAGAEVYLWRPSDLDEIARILGSRWLLIPHTYALIRDGDKWQPRSLWIPGTGRADSVSQQTIDTAA